MEKTSELLVIDPSIIRPEFETFELIGSLSKIPVSFHLPAFEGMQSIWDTEKNKNCVGAIILGSAASVREKRSWQSELITWIEKKISPHFPLLGICFGHQLLAHMRGASVVDCGQKNLGFRSVKILDDTRLGLRSQELPLFVSHNEKVQEIPEGFEIFASSGLIEIDALRHKELPIWSFQAHIDATEAFALNSHYTDRSQFFNLKEGNSLLKTFLEHTELYTQRSSG